MTYLDGVDESAKYAAEFWRESHEKRKRREEIEAMPFGLARYEAVLQDVWTQDNSLFATASFFFQKREAQDHLDEWLMDDSGYGMAEVYAVLDLR